MPVGRLLSALRFGVWALSGATAMSQEADDAGEVADASGARDAAPHGGPSEDLCHCSHTLRARASSFYLGFRIPSTSECSLQCGLCQGRLSRGPWGFGM